MPAASARECPPVCGKRGPMPAAIVYECPLPKTQAKCDTVCGKPCRMPAANRGECLRQARANARGKRAHAPGPRQT
eukprot:7200192-Lingulodinium_polyedra.AAC.1